jgi:hypothetical protein
VEEERERNKAAQEEAEVEGHRNKAMTDDDAASDPGRRESDDESDVEAHRFKA